MIQNLVLPTAVYFDKIVIIYIDYMNGTQQRISNDIEILRDLETLWQAEQVNLSTLISKDIPEEEREQHKSDLNKMEKASQIISTAREQLEKLL